MTRKMNKSFTLHLLQLICPLDLIWQEILSHGNIMKYLVCLMICCGLYTEGCFAQGVDFQHVSFSQALKMAEKAGKGIFIDFYTEWCGPCKRMSNEVFPRKEVGEYFNRSYVALQLDAEKGEGKELAEKFNIRAYPTFIVLNAGGTEVFRTSGFRPAAEFVEKIRKGTHPAWSPEGMARRYAKGERTPELIQDYALFVLEQGKIKEGEKVIDEYFAALPARKKAKPGNFFLYRQFAFNLSDSKARYLFGHKNDFVKYNGRENVEELLSNWLRIELLPYFTLRSAVPVTAEGLQQVKADIGKADLRDAGRLGKLTEIAEARVAGDWKKYLETCKACFPDLRAPDRFAIMLNLTELNGESKEIKSMAAALIREHMDEIDRFNQRILKMQMYELEGKKEYTFQAEVEGAESGEVVMTSYTNRGFRTDTFPFSGHRIRISVGETDTMQMTLKILSEGLGSRTKQLGMNYPHLSLLLVPGEFAVVKLRLEKGKIPSVDWIRGGEVSHDFVRLNYEQVKPAELSYRQLTVDNVIQGGDIRNYKEEFGAYQKANKENIMNFVRENPTSYVTAMKLLEHYIWFDENEIERIYEQFPVSLKATSYGRVIKRKLDAGRPYRIGMQAADFKKKEMNGKWVSLSEWKGKYVLLDFWGSWCGPCRASHPHLKELYQRYGNRMVFVNIAQENVKDLGEAQELWKNAVREDGLTWTQVLNNEGREECDLLNLFHITSFPTKILIDPDGKIAGRYVGAMADPAEKLAEVLDNVN